MSVLLDKHRTSILYSQESCTNYYMPQIGERIRLFREQRGLSQQGLADQINALIDSKFKRATISNYENGVSTPSAKILKAISTVLGIPLNELMTDDLLSYQGDLESFAGRLKANITKELTKKISFDALLIYTIILKQIKQTKNGNQRQVRENLKRDFKKNEIIKELLTVGVLDDSKIQKLIDDYISASPKKKTS